jgi:glycerophosphoryl diester phosphodiesterase
LLIEWATLLNTCLYLSTSPVTSQGEPPPRWKLSVSQPRILAHRGASGYLLENSLEAFRDALNRGADGVELDVHASRDGGLIVHHDAVIPGLGPIASSSLAAARNIPLSNGQPAPTLAEVLEALGPAEVWIEVKSLPPEWDHALLAVIRAAPAPERYAVHSFDHRIVARLGLEAPRLRRGVLSASYPVDPAGQMLEAGATVLWQVASLIDAELVAAIHRTGGEIIAWTVNDSAAARTLAALGVDALCGNFPERLRVG